MAENMPTHVSVIPARDVIVFPGIITPIFVRRPRTLKALESAMLHEKAALVVGQRNPEEDDPAPHQLYNVGTLCGILQMVRIPGGAKVLVEGIVRVEATSYSFENDLLMADIEPRPWNVPHANLLPLQRSVLEQFQKYNHLQQKIPSEVMGSILTIENPLQLVDVIGAHINLKIETKQALLEIFQVEDALKFLLKTLFAEIDILQMEKNIQEKVRSQVEQHNREYYLREQMKAIQTELGNSNFEENSGEIKELVEKIESAQMNEEAKAKAMNELDRLKKMPSMSPEAVVIRTYLDWLISLPWGVSTEDFLDINRAGKILNEDHYGLEKVKDRILEFLAVRRLISEGHEKEAMRAQVICFVGAPGVGKTSLGRSIARALGRNFVSFSLGGLRDEAEIRGHRRTYIGSLPGRIIQQLRKAGTRNPVMLLDEIDKLGNDFRGDPSSALLEVLDPHQNYNFSDHYLDVPFDLREILFITTANSTHSIPKPLLDRMEIIRISGYVQQEKIQIARRHIIPRVLRENGVSGEKLNISKGALEHLISEYTREAGVRELDRQISNVARKVARKIVDSEGRKAKKEDVYKISVKNLSEYLGPPKLFDTRISDAPSKGLVTGLAWTEAGGDVLMIEAAIMKGKGNIVLTGNLGDVMKESARIAISHLRSRAKELKLGRVNWDKIDIHLHVPDGAVPKDGPSAGVTMATAILSAVGGREVRNDIAMTGELSLQGRVLPVGGIKEKILAAKRYGINKIILPSPNRVDIEEIQPEIIKEMEFRYASEVGDVFGIAFS